MVQGIIAPSEYNTFQQATELLKPVQAAGHEVGPQEIFAAMKEVRAKRQAAHEIQGKVETPDAHPAVKEVSSEYFSALSHQPWLVETPVDSASHIERNLKDLLALMTQQPNETKWDHDALSLAWTLEHPESPWTSNPLMAQGALLGFMARLAMEEGQTDTPDRKQMKKQLHRLQTSPLYVRLANTVPEKI